MRIRDIVKQWLKDNGYQGIFNLELNCACIASEMADEHTECPNFELCEPGWLRRCEKCEREMIAYDHDNDHEICHECAEQL